MIEKTSQNIEPDHQDSNKNKKEDHKEQTDAPKNLAEKTKINKSKHSYKKPALANILFF